MPNSKNTPFSLNKGAYSLASENGEDVELTLHGDVVSERPKDWWTGEAIEGDFIIGSELTKELDTCKKRKSLTIRLNSYGGDSVVGMEIHNKIRELSMEGVKTTCIIDAVAMSAGSIIACACDTVKAFPSSLFMIHKCWSYYFGGYNADELRTEAEAHDAYDRAYAAAYVRKTGASEATVLQMMSDNTYLTGRDALDRGFVTELVEEDEPLELAASADGRTIFAGTRKIHMCPGMFAPDTIPTVSKEPECSEDKKQTADDEAVRNGGTSIMTIDELREQQPELVSQIEADARSSVSHNDAILAERKRLSDIDEIAGVLSEELVHEAKYGETACSAAELTLRAVKAAAKTGANFLSDLAKDSDESNADDVEAAQAPDVNLETKTDEQIKAEVKANVKKLLGEKED